MNSKRKAKIPSLRSTLGNEKGVIMSIVIMLIAFLTVVGSAALMSSKSDLKTSINYKGGTQAFYIAEAGLQAAVHELDDSDGTDDFGNVVLPLTYDPSSFGHGTYTVKLELNPSTPPPKIIDITSTGIAPNGSTRTVKAQVVQGTQPPTKAIISNSAIPFPISGNLDLTGSCGGMHSNGDLTVSGNPTAELAGGFTSSGYMNISGNPCIGNYQCDEDPQPEPYVLDTEEDKTIYENDYSGQPNVPIAKINPADVAPRVAALGETGKGYVLNDNGTVIVDDASNPITCDAATGLCTGGVEPTTIPSGWAFSSGRWEVSGDTAADGVFYAETAVHVSGNPGSTATPWQATIIARDSIEWSGNPDVKPYPTSDAQLQGIMIMTGNDLKISGNAGINGQGGAVLVHQQLDVSGSLTLDGYFIAGNGSPTWTGDPFPTSSSGTDLVSTHTMSGNPIIHYDCNQVVCNNSACGLPTVKITAGSWTEF